MKFKILLLLIYLLQCFPVFLSSQVSVDWIRTHPGIAKDLKLDKNGNIYVTGVMNPYPFFKYATMKYNSSGIQQWVSYYEPSSSSINTARSFAIDDSGNVYVTGSSKSSNETTIDYATIKYNADGVQQWVALYNGISNGTDEANSISIGLNGNIYVTGRSDSVIYGQDFATIVYNSSGVQQQVLRYNGVANSTDYAVKVVSDEKGNFYVAGSSTGIGASLDFITIKYNSSGIREWVARYNGPGSSNDVVNSMVYSKGGIYVTGYSVGYGTREDAATVKYDSSGVLKWINRYNGTRNSSDAAKSIVADSTGNVYVTGFTTGIATNPDFITIKYSSSGVQQWATTYAGPGSNDDEGRSIAVDNSSDVYVTGTSTAYNKYITVKYNSSGIQQWIQINGNDCSVPPNPVICWGYGSSLIAVDNLKNVFVSGYQKILFGNQNTDFYTIKYKQAKILNLNLLLEGFYSEQTNSMVKDSLKVFFRSYNSPYNIVDSSKGVVDSSGMVSLNFYNLSYDTNYFITIKHRNSIETWSSAGVAFVSDSISYDFTSSSSQAYGNNMILKGSKYTFYSGDVNQDGIIDASDLSLVDNAAFNTVSGYVKEDVTGDNFVDASDLSIVDNNVARGVTVVRPQ